MKHSLKITLLLLFIFVLAQINGLFVVDYYIDIKESSAAGRTVVYEEKYAEANITPPVVENESASFVYIFLALLMGTAFVLLLIKFKQGNFWKLWFFLSVVVTLVISLNTWIFRLFASFSSSTLLFAVTVLIAGIFAYYKVFRQNVFIHNISEVFIYGGLAALLVPIMNMTSIVIVLILVGLYDMYAVWKSKHMIAMAEFQTEQKVFAGLFIPYQIDSSSEEKQAVVQKKSIKSITSKKITVPVPSKVSTAILGGGDVAFPLLFSGVLMKTVGNYFAPALTTVTTTIALALLFYYGEKGKFYPAIPFVAAGCFVGYGLYFVFG